MILLDKVIKSYNNSYNAVNNVSLEIKDGEIFGLLGPNGAGKTSTIKMITGITSPNYGRILINGIDINKTPISAKEQFGYVSDNPDIFLRLTGLEYLNFMADIYNISKETRAIRIEELSRRFEMNSALLNKIQSYSHGMRQKISIMGVMLHRPKVWILDEPLIGLDPKSAYILKEMMREHARLGNTVLFSTHILDVAEKLCDRVAIMNRGSIIFSGSVEEMLSKSKNDNSLEEIFMELVNDEQ